MGHQHHLHIYCVDSSDSEGRPALHKRNTNNSPKREEEISLALVKMIAVNMLPILFCNSAECKEFMSVVDPEYRCPCSQTILKRL